MRPFYLALGRGAEKASRGTDVQECSVLLVCVHVRRRACTLTSVHPVAGSDVLDVRLHVQSYLQSPIEEITFPHSFTHAVNDHLFSFVGL